MMRATLAAFAAFALAAPAARALDIGDPAPPIEVKTWLKNTPVTLESAKGKVLVVEFWATWCQPCRQTIPHVNSLHKKYNDKDVILVGLTEEDEETAKKFMDTMVMDYHVGIDDASKTNSAYMKGIAGIPHAFVVDKAGKVAWHGHPLAGMAGVIKELVAGEFDVERSKKLSAFKEQLQEAARRRDVTKMMAVVDEMIKAVPDDPDGYRIKRAMLRDQGKDDEAWDALIAMAKACPKEVGVLIEAALSLATAGDLERRDLPAALAFAEQAAKGAEPDSTGVFATLARVHYELGHIAKAADVATKAAAKADGEEKRKLETHAAFYRKELERRAKDPDAKL